MDGATMLLALTGWMDGGNVSTGFGPVTQNASIPSGALT